MNLTLISDTHGKHNEITKDLIGGDILIHAGDISSMGYKSEIKSFLDWFSSLDNYKCKIFIAGNHDFLFEDSPTEAAELVSNYWNVIYLQDAWIEIEGLKIYGSPYQPWFYDWAFNLHRGEEIARKWVEIPNDTDILITHGPAYQFCDYVLAKHENVGCIDLYHRILDIKPILHVSGHIHQGYGMKEFNDSTFVNASVVNEAYKYTNKPIDLIIENKKIIL